MKLAAPCDGVGRLMGGWKLTGSQYTEWTKEELSPGIISHMRLGSISDIVKLYPHEVSMEGCIALRVRLIEDPHS